jgi:cytochrome c-type protein NapB
LSPAQGVDAARVLRRVAGIALSLLGMIVLVVFLVPEAENIDDFRAVAIVPEQRVGKPIPSEAGPFRDLREELHPVVVGSPSPHVVVPTRLERRERRVYEGAPPWIPHPVSAELDRNQDCTPCHNFGGYNPGIRTYSPRSPHPEFTNCLQCHVPRLTNELFTPTDWVTPPWPEYGQGSELVGAPPPIPHTLQLREHCLSCHGGSSAAPDVRTTHPERFNCRQCHLPTVDEGAVFSRPPDGGGGP